MLFFRHNRLRKFIEMDLAEKCLKDFFKTLRKIKYQWESLVNESERPLIALQNQTEQLRLVSGANLDDEFTKKFPDIKERLIGKIILGIEQEMMLLRRILESMSLHTELLKSKYLAVEQAYYKIKPDDNEEFNILRPTLSDMLEYTLDVFRLYQASWVTKQFSMSTADYMDSKSINLIERSFVEDKLKKDHVQYILSLTELYEES